jgi:hypothetical protein
MAEGTVVLECNMPAYPNIAVPARQRGGGEFSKEELKALAPEISRAGLKVRKVGPIKLPILCWQKVQVHYVVEDAQGRQMPLVLRDSLLHEDELLDYYFFLADMNLSGWYQGSPLAFYTPIIIPRHYRYYAWRNPLGNIELGLSRAYSKIAVSSFTKTLKKRDYDLNRDDTESLEMERLVTRNTGQKFSWHRFHDNVQIMQDIVQQLMLVQDRTHFMRLRLDECRKALAIYFGAVFRMHMGLKWVRKTKVGGEFLLALPGGVYLQPEELVDIALEGGPSLRQLYLEIEADIKNNRMPSYAKPGGGG